MSETIPVKLQIRLKGETIGSVNVDLSLTDIADGIYDRDEEDAGTELEPSVFAALREAHDEELEEAIVYATSLWFEQWINTHIDDEDFVATVAAIREAIKEKTP